MFRESLFQAAADLSPARAIAPEYEERPVAFIRERLGADLTEDQEAVARSVRDNRITLVPSANAVGKTFGAGGLAVWWAAAFSPAKIVLTAAPPEDNLRRLLWGELSQFFDTAPDLLPEYLPGVPASMRILYSAQHWIEGRTIPISASPQDREARFSGVHSPHLLFIVDEGDAVPGEIYRAIESCMSGEHDRLLILFNPRSPSGAVYNMIREGRGNVIGLTAFDHPNVRTGEVVIPGAVSRERTVERIFRWTRPLIEGEAIDDEVSTFIVPDFLDGEVFVFPNGTRSEPLIGGERRLIVQNEFAYMVLGRYPTSLENQLIDRAKLFRAQERWRSYVRLYGERPAEGIRPRTGQDVAEFGQDTNVLIDRWGSFVGSPIKWKKVDVIVSAERGERHVRRVGSEFLFVDATGIGAAVAPAIRKGGLSQAIGVKTSVSPTRSLEEAEAAGGDFGIYRDQLFWALRTFIHTDPAAMIPPSEELRDDLLAMTYSSESGKLRVISKKKLKKIIGRSPDEADALALTFAEPEVDSTYQIMPAVPIRSARRPGGRAADRETVGVSGALVAGGKKGKKESSKRRRRRR